MEVNKALAVLGIIFFVAGIVLAFVTAMSYLGGILSGQFASALQSHFIGAIATILLIVIGGLILFFSAR